MPPRNHEPDPTPPFLSADLIQGWIRVATSDVREKQHEAEMEHLRQLHAIELAQAGMAASIRALAGDGGNDLGSVGRLAKVVDGFVSEQRESNKAAGQQRTQQGEQIELISTKIQPLDEIKQTAEQTKKQLGEIKHIPKVIRDLWKLVLAVVGGIVLMMTLWSKLHPQTQINIGPQQIKQGDK
jgi:hypothetical protein